MPMIEIWDGPSVQLVDIVEAVLVVDEMNWSLLEFWGVAHDEAMNLLALERAAAESPIGLCLSQPQLREFAVQLQQLIDGIVVGYRGSPPARSALDLRVSADVVIEAFDSTFWRVYSRDRAITDELKRHYDDVRLVEPEVVLPPAHDQS